MSDPDLLLKSGDVDGARAALIEKVKSAPADVPARMFLFQLLCVQGDWERARTQLRGLAQISPEAQMLSVAYGQAIEAEQTRAAVFRGEAQPALLVGSSPWAGDLAAALGAFAQGRTAEGEERRALAFDAAPDTPGELDGVAFDYLGDADPRFGPALEAIIAGRWGLLPLDAVSSIKTEGPKDLRDVVWLPVEIAFKSGQSVAGFLPTRYPGSETAENADLRLARSTDWQDSPAGQIGLGQHLLALSGGEERGVLEMRRLTFR